MVKKNLIYRKILIETAINKQDFTRNPTEGKGNFVNGFSYRDQKNIDSNSY